MTRASASELDTAADDGETLLAEGASRLPQALSARGKATTADAATVHRAAARARGISAPTMVFCPGNLELLSVVALLENMNTSMSGPIATFRQESGKYVQGRLMSEKAPSHPPLSMRSSPYSGAIAHMMAVLSMQAIAGCDCQQLKSLLTGVLHVINGIAAETGKKSGMRVFHESADGRLRDTRCQPSAPSRQAGRRSDRHRH